MPENVSTTVDSLVEHGRKPKGLAAAPANLLSSWLRGPEASGSNVKIYGDRAPRWLSLGEKAALRQNPLGTVAAEVGGGPNKATDS